MIKHIAKVLSKVPLLSKVSLMVITATLSLNVVAEKTVTIGYQGLQVPMKHAIDEKMFEKVTGYTIKWRKFDSGAKAITALAAGAVDITVAGSSPIASGISNGVDMELIWVLDNIADAEALVVRDGSGVASPSDLKGKKIGVPFVSTTHFHTLFALEQFGLGEKDVRVINMSPNAIVAAWIRGDIDGAFVWDPALGKIKATGNVLISSKQLGAWGKPTFDGIVANKKFTKSHQGFVIDFLTVMVKADAMYRDAASDITSTHPIVKSVAKLSGAAPESVVSAMKLYEFLDIDAQLSCAWMGCAAKGGAAKALTATAEFLLSQKKVSALKPDYSVYVNPSYLKQAKAKL